MIEKLLYKKRYAGYDMVPYFEEPVKHGCIAFGHAWQVSDEGEYECSTCKMEYSFFCENTRKSDE